MLASQMVEVLPLLAQRQEAPTKSAVGDPSIVAVDIFLFFNIAPSHFLLPLLCVSLLLARARRNLLLVNVCITWCICGFASSVLLYAGKQTGPEPSQLLCLAQASLLYAIPPLTSTAVFALVLSVWINLCWRPGERTRGFYFAAMLVGPYVVFFTFASIGASLASKEPFRVSRARRFFYCSIDHKGFSGGLAIYAAIILLMTVILNCWIGVTVWRNNRLLKDATRTPHALPPVKIGSEKKRLTPDDVQFAIRLGIFGVYIVTMVALSFLSIAAPTSPVPDLLFASTGLAVFLVFGTQPKVWLVWRDLFRRAVPAEESHIPTLTPFQLDPLPGQQQKQYDVEAADVPPPVPAKTWIVTPSASAALQSLSRGPGANDAFYGGPAMSEKRRLAAQSREQGGTGALSPTMDDHPYRTATSPEPDLKPRVVEFTSPIDQIRTTQLRGKKPLNSQFVGGQVQSSYEPEGEFTATMASASSDRETQLEAWSYENQGTLAAAASYQSQYLSPTTKFEAGDADMRRERRLDGNPPSELATYSSMGSPETEIDDGRSYNSSNGLVLKQQLLERTRRTDPVIPRF